MAEEVQPGEGGGDGMKYVRLIIGETISEAQIKELTTKAEDFFGHIDETKIEQPEYSVMVEEGGNMVIIETKFTTREHCLRFHSSRAYRSFVQETQHLLVGNYVVKLFREN
jgi:hypothetical protein